MKLHINLPVIIEIEDAKDFNLEVRGFDADEIQQMAMWIVDRWSDGRREFSVEATNHHLNVLIRQAVMQSIQNKMQEQYGSETVEQDGGMVAKWYLEAEKEFHKYFISAHLENADDQ